ncbi:hypothetical protein D3C87_1489520 [compost metagenome]
MRGQGGKGDGGQRDEQQTQARALNKADVDDGVDGHGRRPAGHHVHRPGGQQQTAKQYPANIHFADDLPGKEHAEHRPQSAWPHDHAGGEHRVPHQGLQVGCHQCQRGQVGDANDKDKHHRHRVIAIFEQLQADKGLVMSEGVDNEDVRSDGGHQRFQDDFPGVEPAQLFAAVEEQLNRHDRHAERAKAQPVQACSLVGRGFPYEAGHADKGQQPDRQVDEEHPAPAEVFCQPAAEHRT